MKRAAVNITILLFIAFLLYACDAPTPIVNPTVSPTIPTPVTCPRVAVALTVVELTEAGPGAPIPNAVFTFQPIYEGEAVTFVTGASGNATGFVAPGTHDLRSFVLPPGFLPMQDTAAYGWPATLYASPGDDMRLVFYVHRIAPTPTVTPIAATPTPLMVACPNYAVNCLPVCGANQQVNPYGRCGASLVCCEPMATRTAVPWGVAM